ncbi:MAG: hypothetical protein ABJA87_06985 [bacterium]
MFRRVAMTALEVPATGDLALPVEPPHPKPVALAAAPGGRVAQVPAARAVEVQSTAPLATGGLTQADLAREARREVLPVAARIPAFGEDPPSGGQDRGRRPLEAMNGHPIGPPATQPVAAIGRQQLRLS